MKRSDIIIKNIKLGGVTIKIYTKSGDKGRTSLYDGARVDKDDIRVEAYGTIDELKSTLGVAKNLVDDQKMRDQIEWIQTYLFKVGGELATQDGEKFKDRIKPEDIKQLEEWIDLYVEKMDQNGAFTFILPGTNGVAAALHVARTVCRRAERRMISLAKVAVVADTIMKFVNRLSDCLYAMARYMEDDIVAIRAPKSSEE